MTAADAVRFGEVIVVSVAFGRYRELPTEGVGGKVVIDDGEAKRIVAELIDQIGFGAADGGTLAEGGREHQPESPVHMADPRTAARQRQYHRSRGDAAEGTIGS